MKQLYSTAYLPPLAYIQSLLYPNEILLEAHEHYVKQTYRNRCCIATASGIHSLTIPVRHENLFRIPIRQVRISYDERWNKIHWRSIESAYRNAPYFEFFENDFREILNDPGEYLFDFNLRLLNLLLSCFRISIRISITDTYISTSKDLQDMRNLFLPGLKYDAKPYPQVFRERCGFIANLSSIDYLFNMGRALQGEI